MESEDEMKRWIDSASYSELLRRWRFASIGDPIFMGEVGRYYSDVMASKREELGPGEHARISKEIGWDR